MAFFPVKHWDTGAEKWDETVENRNNPHYFYYHEADLYIDDLLRNARIALELGAGTCGSTIKHASNDTRIVAIDYSRAMIDVGRKKLQDAGLLGNVDLLVADEGRLPFRDMSFEAVFSRGVALSYATDPEGFVAETFRVLRSGYVLGIDFMNKLVARKAKGRSFCRFERINGILYYVELFTEDGKQKRIGYRLPEGFNPPQPIEEGLAFGGFPSRPEWLNLNGLEKEEWWAAFYAPSEARKLFKRVGFKVIRLFPLGCFTYPLKDKNLYNFLRDNRDYVSRLQKELARIFRVESGVHIFLTALKPGGAAAKRSVLVSDSSR